MKKLLLCTALVMCAGMACAQAEEKNDWHFNIGAMYEIENVEGYGEDMDGLAEPSVYFNAANGPWRISLAYYQEGPVDYSAGKRGTWFDRPELEVHYQFLESDDFSFGLTGGFRNYGYHYVDEPGKDTANMQRWKIAPDWDVKLTDDLRFNGWLSMYKFANDLNTTGYADTRVETETGLQYTFNETVALRVNYYLERAFNMDDSRNNGEFSTQEIRAYLPLTLGNHSVTPYTPLGWIAGVTGTGRMILNVKAMILTVWVYFTVMISRMVFPFRWNTRLSGRITTKATAINSIMRVLG